MLPGAGGHKQLLVHWHFLPCQEERVVGLGLWVMSSPLFLLRPWGSFIRDQVQSCGDSERITATMGEFKDLGPQAYDTKTKKLSDCLRRIADELNENTELQK